MKRYSILALLLALIMSMSAVGLLASDISDAIFSAPVQVKNTGTSTTKVAVPFSLSTAALISANYLSSNALDSAVRTSTGADVAFMPASPSGTAWPVFIPAIAAAESQNLALYCGGGSDMAGKIRYFPAAGGMAVDDDASLELGNNFEIEIAGYVDTTVTQYIINKDAAFTLGVNSGVIAASIPYVMNETQSYSTGTNPFSAFGASWVSQGIKFTSNVTVSGFTLNLKRTATYAGAFNYGIYATSSNLPTGAALASGTVANIGNLPTTASDVYFALSSSVNLTGGTQYAIVASAPSMNGTTSVTFYSSLTGTYANGRYAASSNSGSSWTGYDNYDLRFSVSGVSGSGNITVTSSGISSGEHNVKVTADATNLKLYIDTVLADTTALSGVSVTNNANNWTFFAAGSMPYVEYATVKVGGSLAGSWRWQYAETFSDLAGNGNTATPTFRTTSSDGDVTATLGVVSVLTAASYSAGYEAPTPLPVTETPTEPPLFFSDLSFDSVPFADVFNSMLDMADIPYRLFWYPLIYGLATIIAFAGFAMSRDLFVPIALSMLVVFTFSVIFNIIALWPIFPMTVIGVAELVRRRLVSV